VFKQLVIVVLSATLSLALYAGCSSSSTNQVNLNLGSEGEPCYEDGTCVEGLICNDGNICMVPPRFYKDNDGDGFGVTSEYIDADSSATPENYSEYYGDCDDEDEEVNPESTISENTDYKKDFNCDGVFGYYPKEVIQDPILIRGLAGVDYQALRKTIITIRVRDDLKQQSTKTTYDVNGNVLTYVLYQEDLDSPIMGSGEYTYDAKGKQLTYKKHEEGLGSSVALSWEYTYDANGNELVYIQHQGGLGAPATMSLESSYDTNGNRLTYKKHNQGDLDSPVTSSAKYTYDANGNRLTEKEYFGDLDSPITRLEEYTYDANGNKLTYREHGHGDLDSPITRYWKSTYDTNGNKLTYESRRGDLDSPVTRSQESSDYEAAYEPTPGSAVYMLSHN
jgi:hypothetical protein